MRIRILLIALTVSAAFTPFLVSQASAPKYTAASVAKGKALFKQLQCASCHMVDEKGGCLAPDLNGVTQRRNERYLTLRLSNAKGAEDKFIKLIGHEELVAHPRFAPAQVKALIAYLSTFKPAK
jgi:mono/diheme cytochrome c family protein